MTRCCMTCKYYDEYFTWICSNTESRYHTKEMKPANSCSAWSPYRKGKNIEKNDTKHTGNY